jgi:ribosome-binding protein aMBF1 (putative translation factor)
MNKTKTAQIRTATEILRAEMPLTREMEEYRKQVRTDNDVAQKIHDLRKKAGLTQRQLAEKIGTQQSVISDLEAADYTGHSLAMLTRIAEALDKRVEIRFVPAKRRLQPA